MPAENIVPYDSANNTDNESSDSDNDNEKYIIYKDNIKIFKETVIVVSDIASVSEPVVPPVSESFVAPESKEIIISFPRMVATCKYQAILKNGVIEFGYL